MITFILKKDKIKIDTDSKEEKKKLKQRIENLKDKGFDKNSAKAIVLSELIKLSDFSKEDNSYIFKTIPEGFIND